MDGVLPKLLLLAPAYLLGSVPFGLVVTRLIAGKDVRAIGSGNIGATNVVRAAGKAAGAATLFLDALKGAVPTLVGLRLFGVAEASALGLAAFAGHLFPIYLHFRGGKGVATALGVFLVLSPFVALWAVVAYAVTLGLTRVSALGSLAAVAVALALVVASRKPAPVVLACAGIAVAIGYRHRSNLTELWAKRRP